jgi:hypothetical protein
VQRGRGVRLKWIFRSKRKREKTKRERRGKKERKKKTAEHANVTHTVRHIIKEDLKRTLLDKIKEPRISVQDLKAG